MKFDVTKMTSKVKSAVGVTASIAIGLAITLTAAVHIKHCIKDLLPSKERNVRHVIVKYCKDDVDVTKAVQDAMQAEQSKDSEAESENDETPSEPVDLNLIKGKKEKKSN